MKSTSLRSAFEGLIQADAEQRLFEELQRLRKTQPRLFAKSVFKIARRIPEGKSFVKQLDLTDEEFAAFINEAFKHQGLTEAEGIKSLGLKLEPTPEPTGAELLSIAINKLRQENPTRKLHRLQEIVAMHIKKQFAKQPKPFTDQDVEAGAEWFSRERKKRKGEMDAVDRRSRSRANVPMKSWNEFCLRRFQNGSPKFLKEYRKAVRAKARNVQNASLSRNDTN